MRACLRPPRASRIHGRADLRRAGGDRLQRAGVLLLILITAATLGAPPATRAEPPADEAAPPCPILAPVAGVGIACTTPSGLLAAYDDRGAFVGTTHGPDPAGGAAATLAPPPADPTCVKDKDRDLYSRIIYARPRDAPDRYDAVRGSILDIVRQANGYVRAAAARTGHLADLKVACDASGTPLVDNVTLGADLNTSTSFATVVQNLRHAGYTSPSTKHWAFVDVRNGVTNGVANVYASDDPSEDNLNNGARTQFAVVWNWWDDPALGARVALHELSHTMGAVQPGAPRATLGFHCNVGADVMCYDDGSPGACGGDDWCPPTTCAEVAYDCAGDSYFNASPAASSYLATRWNLAHPFNRFLDRGVLALVNATCASPIGLPQAPSCGLLAYGPTDVAFDVDWGEGAVESVAPGEPGRARVVTRSTAYAMPGDHEVEVTARDALGGSLTRSLVLRVDGTAPTTTARVLTAPAPGAAPGALRWYDQDVTVALAATDAGGTGVDATFYQASPEAPRVYEGPFVVRGHGPQNVAYWSVDRGENVEERRTLSFGIDRTRPNASAPRACGSVCQAPTSVAFGGSDTESGASGIQQLALRWIYLSDFGPVIGETCARPFAGATTADATCDFSGALKAPGEAEGVAILRGPYCLATVARDMAGNSRTSASTCFLLT